MAFGLLSGMLACMLWGVTYLLPLFLPNYDVLSTVFMRTILVGIFSLVLCVFMRQEMRKLTRSDWLLATSLAFLGNLINFLTQLLCVDWAGVSISGISTGAIPVLVAVVANYREKKRGRHFVRMRTLLLPLSLICLGFALVNASEFEHSQTEYLEFFMGVLMGVAHALLWTWYPIKNAEWLQDHPQVSSAAWTTAQCVVLLPVALILYGSNRFFFAPAEAIFGPEPLYFLMVLTLNGVLCYWGAMTLWNVMCKNVPTSLAGQMMVFETIFAVIFGHAFNRVFPAPLLILGITLLVIGISVTMHVFTRRVVPTVMRVNDEPTNHKS